MVILGSLAFILTPQTSPASTLRKPGTAPPASALTPTTTTPRKTTTTTGHKGQVTSSSSSNAVARNVTLGDYAGEGDPAGVAAFGAATGTHPVYATDYLDKGDGWVAMASASNIKSWSSSPYRLSIGVPILPSVGTLAQGATGAYNQYFTILGKNLVSDNEADAVLRLGWEFNGNFFPWQVLTATDAANFVAYWRQIVTTMRAVPGAKFKFLWNPNSASPTTYNPEQAYPGNAYVDYVGIDIYDNFWGSPFTPAVSWGHQLIQQWGLDWLAAFAAEHNKPIAIPEWSDEYRTDGHGLGDDPLFIDNMANWLVTNNVAFANVWCFDSSATYRNNLLDGTFPKALAQFKLDFG